MRFASGGLVSCIELVFRACEPIGFRFSEPLMYDVLTTQDCDSTEVLRLLMQYGHNLDSIIADDSKMGSCVTAVVNNCRVNTLGFLLDSYGTVVRRHLNAVEASSLLENYIHIETANLKLVETFMDVVDLTIEQYNNLLLSACRRGFPKIVEVVLDKLPSNVDVSEALVLACNYGDQSVTLSILLQLLSRRFSFNETVIDRAIAGAYEREHCECLELLNTIKRLHYRTSNDGTYAVNGYEAYISTCSFQCDANNRLTPLLPASLYDACRKQDIAAIDALLHAHPALPPRVLRKAASHCCGNYDALCLLKSAGANLDEVVVAFACTNWFSSRYPPGHLPQERTTELITLIAAGANKNESTELQVEGVMNILYLLAFHGDTHQMVWVAIQLGADKYARKHTELQKLWKNYSFKYGASGEFLLKELLS